MKNILMSIFIFIFFWNNYAQSKIDFNVGFTYNFWATDSSSLWGNITVTTNSENLSHSQEPLQLIILLDASLKASETVGKYYNDLLKEISRYLKSNDIVGIVSFSSVGETILPAQPLNDAQINSLNQYATKVRYNSGKNIKEGIYKALSQVDKFEGAKNSGKFIFIVYASDSKNKIPDLNVTKDIIKKCKEKNISVSSIVYDKYFDERFFIELSTKTFARTYMLEEDSLSFLPLTGKNEIKRITSIFTNNLIIEIELPDGIKVDTVLGALYDDNIFKIPYVWFGIEKNIFFKLSGNHESSDDIGFYLEYRDPFTNSMNNVAKYVDLRVNKSVPTFDENYAPKIIEHNILVSLFKNADMVLNNSSREELFNMLDATVNDLERLEIAKISSYFKGFLENMEYLSHIIENRAIESQLLVKKLKYYYVQKYF